MTRSQEFIKKYAKRLSDGVDYFNPDTSLMPVEDFEKAKVKMLLILPTPHVVKTVSSTVAAINDYIIEHCPGTFLDVAYMPDGSDIKLYDDNNMPYAIGNITHLDVSHFNVVGFSISVLSEIVTAPVMMKSFERCDTPIPLFWSDRKDMKLGTTPIVYCGGITAACGDVMFGEVPGKGTSFVDFMYLGSCDKTNIMLDRLIQALTTGKVTRHSTDADIPGYPDTNTGVEDTLEVSTVQDYIESLFDLTMIYQPQAYKVEFDDNLLVKSNIKINPKARDFVTPFYPHELPNDLSIGRAVINGNGDNTGTTQTQVAEGCSAAGACSFKQVEGTRIFTEKGIVRIEDTQDSRLVQAISPEKFDGVQCCGPAPVVRVVLASGHYNEGDENHKYMVFEAGELVERAAKDLNPGDMVFRRIGTDFEYSIAKDAHGNEFTEAKARLLGFMHGDGHFSTYFNTTHSQLWRCYTKKGEEDYQNLFKELIGGKGVRLCYDNGENSVYEQQASCHYREFFDADLATVSCSSNYIPDVVFCSPTAVRKAYLRGLFDADGWSNDKSIGFTTISSKFAQDVALLLQSVGCDTHIVYNGYFERNVVRGHKPSWMVTIPKYYHEWFRDNIGFSAKQMESDEAGSWCSTTMPRTTELVEIMRSAFVNRDQCRAEHLSNCYQLPSATQQNISVNLLMKFKSIHPEVILPRFYDQVARGVLVPDTISEVVYTGDVAQMWDVVNTETHLCSYGAVITHQCAEGNYCGGWVEKPKDQVLWELREAKKYSAGYKYKPYSFNTNYYTDYKGMLAEFIKRYPKVTFINMRMEELGRDVDALHMMKLIGSNRISAPMEGISPRIQNNLLNKCLSEEALNNFMDDMVHAKMTDIKVGGIFTGYEEEEDFQWICDFVDRFKQRAAMEGGNFPMRLKCTPLVHYPLTPIEYLERKSAKKSYNGEHWLTDEWYEKFREHQVFFKVNGFRYSTFLEQSFVDLGRGLTPLIYKHFISTLAPIYSLRSCATDEFIADLKAMIKDPDVFFGDRDIEKYISPAHRIHIELMGSYIPRARRLLRHKHAGNIFANEPDIRCLKTFDGAKVKCYHTCIANDPITVYSDVTKNADGVLEGTVIETLGGCQRCKTNEQRKWRLSRPTPQTKNSEDIMAVPRIPQIQKIRFILNRRPEYDILNPNNTAHTFLTKFLQKSDVLLDAYHSMVVHNMFWQSGPNMKYSVSGTQIVDTMWSADVISEVKRLVPEVNACLKSVQIVSAKEELKDEKIKVDDYNIFYFESDMVYAMFESAVHDYHGEIKVETGMDDSLTTTTDSSLTVPVFCQKGGKTVGYFCIPGKYNPLNYLSSFLSVCKRTSIDQVSISTRISCDGTYRECAQIDKLSGKEHALISVATGKVVPYGKTNLCKALLSMRLKK